MADINKSMFMDRTSTLLSRVLDLCSTRQEVISANLANIDTPGYRPKEMHFEQELKRAMDKTGAPLRTTNPAHISGGTGILRENFNTNTIITESKTTELNLDSEMAKMTQNNLLYEVAARRLSSRLLALKTVIEGTGR